MTAQSKAIVCAVGAVLILLSIFVQSWWSESERDGDTESLGPTRYCVSGDGMSISVGLSEEYGEKESTWILSGTLTWWAGLLAALALAAAAVVDFRGTKVTLPLTDVVMWLCAAALLCAILFFFVLAPDKATKDLGGSWGFWAYLLGIGAGIAMKFAGSQSGKGRGSNPSKN